MLNLIHCILLLVLAATLGSLVVSNGLSGESLQIQGNSYAMHSPLFELPLYLGLGLVCGMISVTFTWLRDRFSEMFDDNVNLLSRIPPVLRPILGGLLCGIAALFFPQTLFSSYSTLDQLISGKNPDPALLLVELLLVKLCLTSFSLSSGLVGGVFAPSLFVSTFVFEFTDTVLNIVVVRCNSRSRISARRDCSCCALEVFRNCSIARCKP